MSSAEEIREALTNKHAVYRTAGQRSRDEDIVREAARLYADLLDNGRKIEAQISFDGQEWLVLGDAPSAIPNRYLVVPVSTTTSREEK